MLSLSLGHALHPSTPTQGAEPSSEGLASPAGETRAPPAPEDTVTCPGSLQGLLSPTGANDSSLNIPFMEQGDPETLAATHQKVSQGLPVGEEGQKCDALSKLKRNLPVCYLHNSTNGKAGLAGFQICVFAKHVEKHQLRTHCSGCSPSTAKNQSLERAGKGSVTKRHSNFSCCSAAVCAGGRKREEEEQRSCSKAQRLS